MTVTRYWLSNLFFSSRVADGKFGMSIVPIVEGSDSRDENPSIVRWLFASFWFAKCELMGRALASGTLDVSNTPFSASAKPWRLPLAPPHDRLRYQRVSAATKRAAIR